MKRKIALAVMTGMVLVSLLSQPVYAWSLDDDYLDDYHDIPVHNNSYEEYYKNGIMDESGTIQVGGGSITMRVGETKDLSADRSYHSHNEDLQISIVGDKTWASSKPDVASVDSGGTVTAHKRGSARITVTYHDNRAYTITQTIRLTVRNTDPATVSYGTQSFEITEGKRISLAGLLPAGADDITWSTSNQQMASVDADGLVTAGSIGKCTVTASYTDVAGSERQMDFSIRVTSLLLDNRSREITITILQGESVDIIELFYPNIADSSIARSKLACTTGDASVAGVDSGIVQGRQRGSCNITLSEQDGNEIVRSQKIRVLVS